MSAARSAWSTATIVSRRAVGPFTRTANTTTQQRHHVFRPQRCRVVAHQQVRGKRTAAAGAAKRGGKPATSTKGGKKIKRVVARKSTTSGAAAAQEQFPYGLRPVDYTAAPPLYGPPPPPPPKPGNVSRYVFPASLAATVGLVAYFYVNNQNDAFEYWEAMQTGSVPLFDDDDDDDDDFDDDDFEEGEDSDE